MGERRQPSGAWRVWAPAIVAMLGALLTAVGSSAQAQPALCFGMQPTIMAGAGQTNGTPGPDVIMGTNGPNVINGRGGKDKICSLGGADTVLGGAGADQIDLGGGNDSARGGKGNDRIFGRGGMDTLRGNGGSDLLDGGGKADRLIGGGGNDTLRGKAGVDDCTGGGGTDRYAGCNNGRSVSDFDSLLLRATDLGGGWTEPLPIGQLPRGAERLRVCGVDLEGDIGVENFAGLISIQQIASTDNINHTVREQTARSASELLRRTTAEAGRCTRDWSQTNSEGDTSTFEMVSPPALANRADGIAVYRARATTDFADPRFIDISFQTVLIQIRCGPVISRIAVNTGARASNGLLETLTAAAEAKLVNANIGCSSA